MSSDNIWADLFNAQKSMFDSWQKAFIPSQGSKENTESNPFFPFNLYQNNVDMVNNMQKMQSILKQWQEATQSLNWFQNSENDPFKSFNKMYQDFNPMDAKSYTQYWQIMMESWNNLVDQWKRQMEENPYHKNMSNTLGHMEIPKFDFEPLQAWQKIIEAYNPLEMGKYMSTEAKEAIEKSMNANQFKLAMYKIWEEMKDSYFDPASENVKEKTNEMGAKYEEMLKEYLLPMIPSEMRTFIESPYILFKDSLALMQKFSLPWIESFGKMADLTMQAVFKDPKKTSDILLLWKDNYNKTMGELIKSPVVGSNRELIEQQNQAVDRMVDMALAMSEYIGSIMTVATEKSQEGFERYFEKIQKGEQPQTFNAFYNEISLEIENAIESLYYTDEFAQILGKATDSCMQFKIEVDKLIEKYLSDTPIITVDKVDNTFKNVYELKKEVKNLNKRIADMEMKQGEGKGDPKDNTAE